MKIKDLIYKITYPDTLDKIRSSLLTNDETQFWKRNLIYLCLAQFMAMVGMSSAVPFLPFFIRELGITNMNEAQLWSGLIFAGPFTLSIVTVPLWGIFGDRYGQKLSVIRAILGLGIVVSVMSLVQNVGQLLVLRILQGAVSGFIAASLAFVSSNTPQNRSGFAIGMLQSALAAGNIIGPFLGGIISDIAGVRQVFLIVGAMCLLTGLLVIFNVKESHVQSKSDDEQTLMSNIRFVWNSVELKILIFLIILTQAGLFFTFPIFPYFVESIHTPKLYLSTITGSLIAVVGIFNIIFAPRWGRRNDIKDYKKTLKVASFVSGTALSAQILIPHYLLLFPLRAVIGIFSAALVPTIFSAISKRLPKEKAGGVMGLASSATIFGSMSAFLLCGITASNLGMEWCFIISGILLIFVTFFTPKK